VGQPSLVFEHNKIQAVVGTTAFNTDVLLRHVLANTVDRKTSVFNTYTTVVRSTVPLSIIVLTHLSSTMWKYVGTYLSSFSQATKALKESRGVALLRFQTSVLEGGEGSASRPGRFLPPGKTRYPLYRSLGGPQGRSRQVRKISPPPRFDPWTVQTVASRYTDCDTRGRAN
jgi:hypothetical protein